MNQRAPELVKREFGVSRAFSFLSIKRLDVIVTFKLSGLKVV